MVVTNGTGAEPTELRSEQAKSYVEPSLKERIVKYQHREGLPTFSDAGRELWIKQLETEGL